MLDTAQCSPPLTVAESSRLQEKQASAAQRLAGEAAAVRAAFIKTRAKRLVERTGASEQEAIRTVTRQCAGILHPSDIEFAGCTVGDVLADPERFEGATLADPLEGVQYGRCKAKIMRRADGSVWIHSFAHGRTTYELKLERQGGAGDPRTDRAGECAYEVHRIGGERRP